MYIVILAISSPKPRTTTKYEPSSNSGSSNRTTTTTNTAANTVTLMPRRSTTLYEKTSSTEKTNAISTESKYVSRYSILLLSIFSYLSYFCPIPLIVHGIPLISISIISNRNGKKSTQLLLLFIKIN